MADKAKETKETAKTETVEGKPTKEHREPKAAKSEAKPKKIKAETTQTQQRQPLRKGRDKARDIGIDVPLPSGTCNDANCPFHGELPVRGQTIVGRVVSDSMDKTVVVQKDYMRIVPKYERYEKRRGKYSAHNPPCIAAKSGQEVTIAECRPLSKTVSFVVIRKKE